MRACRKILLNNADYYCLKQLALLSYLLEIIVLYAETNHSIYHYNSMYSPVLQI